MVFEEIIEGTFIKIKEVEQSLTGDKYAIAYNDDGHFKLMMFNKETGPDGLHRDEAEIKRTTIDVN